MKIKLLSFFIIGLLSLPAFANLRTQLDKKTANYNYLINHYSELLKAISKNDASLFCKTVEKSYDDLVVILNDDGELIKELRRVDHPDYHEYATQLEDNIASPLFSYGASMDTCQNGDLSNITRMHQSMQYHVMNIDYLKMIHLMWIEGFESYLILK
jgi:hypothetical protein